MRRLFLFSTVFSCVFFGSFSAQADGGPQKALEYVAISQTSWDQIPEDEKVLIDRLAADFYESSLRWSQARRIEATTAKIYLTLSPEERKAFRDNRLRYWQSLPEKRQRALRNVKRPEYDNLTEIQKGIFRRHAMESLGWGVSPYASVNQPSNDI